MIGSFDYANFNPGTLNRILFFSEVNGAGFGRIYCNPNTAFDYYTTYGNYKVVGYSITDVDHVNLIFVDSSTTYLGIIDYSASTVALSFN